nr:murein L,D-transpeptidase catalytic domain family protein [Flavobacterium sp. HSC-32F16]
MNQLKKVIKSDPKFNKEVAFLIDMKIPSGKNRFFVYDIKNNKIIDKGIVAHGSGSETGIQGKLKFSNVSNSLSTSLGNYYIGNYYYGKFGKAYKLYGLDKTNDNAFNRDIVFHYYYDVPYEEKDGYICNSHGCPMVNKNFFEKIAKIIDKSDSNILLSIYY